MSINTVAIKTFVDLNLRQIRSVHSIANRLGIPYDTLRKGFLRNENVPLAEYIAERKVVVMKEHLTVTDAPCYVICFEAGLREDTGAKVFKRVTGLTMQEYRVHFTLRRTA